MNPAARLKTAKSNLPRTQARAREQHEEVPLGTLMPEGIRRLMAEKGVAPGAKYFYSEFDPSTVTSVRQNIAIGDKTDVALVGRRESLVRVDMVSIMKGARLKAVAFIDSDFEAMKAEFSMGGMKLTQLACDEAYARSANGQFDPLKASAPVSPVAIEDPRHVVWARYKLLPVDANKPLVFPNIDGQIVRSSRNGAREVFEIEESLVSPAQKSTHPYEGNDPAALAALKPSAYVESDNPKIIEAAKEVVGDETDALTAARAIEHWVNEYITNKTLTVGYASAATTLQSRAGDCTEHAVLTAALCRAAGIPCRVMTGLAYTREIGDLKHRFVGHQWDQVYIGGKWITIDAALGPDASRIVLLAGGEDPASFIALLQDLGNIKIMSVDARKVAPVRPGQ